MAMKVRSATQSSFGPAGIEPPGEVGEDRTPVIAVGGGDEPPAGPHAQALLAHDPHGPFVVHYNPIPAKLGGDPSVAVAWVLGADFAYFLDDFASTIGCPAGSS